MLEVQLQLGYPNPGFCFSSGIDQLQLLCEEAGFANPYPGHITTPFVPPDVLSANCTPLGFASFGLLPNPEASSLEIKIAKLVERADNHADDSGSDAGSDASEETGAAAAALLSFSGVPEAEQEAMEEALLPDSRGTRPARAGSAASTVRQKSGASLWGPSGVPICTIKDDKPHQELFSRLFESCVHRSAGFMTIDYDKLETMFNIEVLRAHLRDPECQLNRTTSRFERWLNSYSMHVMLRFVIFDT